MASAGFILAINLFIAALFALTFLIIAANSSDRAPRWFALAYLFGLFYIGTELIIPIQVNPRLTYTVGFAAFLGAVSAVTCGIASRYRQPVSWMLLGGIGLVAVTVNWFAYDAGRDSLLRAFAYQAPYALLQGLAALFVWRSRRRQPMDVALMVLFMLSVLQFLSKPMIALWTGGAGDFAQSYITTTYALYSQSLGAILQVAVGLAMLILVVRDMLGEIIARSETDPLSLLLNRRGFEERAEAALQAAAQGGVPATLVASDLDNFKAINDGFGHGTGDEVIVAFAGLLAADPPPRAIAARMGGEEFAVLLPGVNLAAARLYAEALRSVLASLPMAGLPAQMRVTASFGIAEYEAGEGLSDLRRRADAALYVSKRDGRDRVSAAPPTSLDLMPVHPLAGEAMRSA